jgi:hypothetical protein
MIDDTTGPRRLFFFFFFFQQPATLGAPLLSRFRIASPDDPAVLAYLFILSTCDSSRGSGARSFRRTRNRTVAGATSYLEVSPGRSHSSRAAAKKPNDRAEIDWHVRGGVVRS